MRQTLFLLTMLFALSFFTSCEDNDFHQTGGGEIRMPLDNGCVLTEGQNKILTLTADYPRLNVSSIFSLVSKAPEIAYVAQVHDLVEIPMETSESFSTSAIIHNQGGYLVKMRLIRPGQSESEECRIKILIKEGPVYEGDAPDYLTIEYAIFRK